MFEIHNPFFNLSLHYNEFGMQINDEYQASLLSYSAFPSGNLARERRERKVTFVSDGRWVSDGAKIGDGTIVHAGAVIEDDCVIGRNCRRERARQDP